jgi:hypothetical protein
VPNNPNLGLVWAGNFAKTNPYQKKTLGRGLIRQPNGRGFAMTPKWFNMVGCDLWMFID